MIVQPEMLIDSMVQGLRSHLPADLAGAARAIGLNQKQTAGKALIKMFADESREETPQSHPEEWAQFRSYARDDVAAMRDVFKATMPLSRRMWSEYWASERINHRGVPVDLPFVRGAAALAARLMKTANADTARLTGCAVKTVRQNAAMLNWIRLKLQHLPEVDRILTREFDLVEDEDGEKVSVPKYSLGRENVEALITYLEHLDDTDGLTDEEWTVLQLLEVRLFGASATPAKFQKILDTVDVDGRLKGQYVYSGAAATIRFSSKGVQIHNLSRDTVGSRDDEIEAIELITEKGADAYDEIKERFGYVGKVLSRLIRPVFMALEGKTFVYCDLASIEAVVCPWLTADEDADPLLDAIRANHRDPSLPDMYRTQAGKMLGKDPLEVTKGERQSHGKTVQLALQFLGGKGSLHNMGRIYRVHFEDAEADQIVDRWRAENRWATRFGERVWESVLWCMENPGEPRQAGRITLLYDANYLRGTLFAVLPNGDPLTYTGLRWREVEAKDKSTGEVKTETRLTVRKGRGVVPVWKGEFCLAGDSQVLTRAGWKRLDAVGTGDLVWDGVEFVAHEGLCFQGVKSTIPLNGVRMTPDHSVLTTEGWRDASQCNGLHGAPVWLPDCDTSGVWPAAQGQVQDTFQPMAVSVRLRVGGGENCRRGRASSQAGWGTVSGAMRSQDAERHEEDARDVEASGLHRLAERAPALHAANRAGVEELRRTRDQDGPEVGFVRDFLGRHGADVGAGTDAGSGGQRRAVQPGELSVGDRDCAGRESQRGVAHQHACVVTENRNQFFDAVLPLAPEPVYDLLSAGPRSRFVVLGVDGPFIVHNCNNFTQATAAALLRQALLVLNSDDLPDVVMHTHDEITVMVDTQDLAAGREALLSVMLDVPDWAEGLPIAADSTVSDWYSKTSED